MFFEPPKLYPLTDRRLSGLSHAEQVARLCEGGARLVQLRGQSLSPREVIGRTPLVAIGGINAENAPPVLDAGADSVAVIGALLAGGDPAEITRRTRDFLARL